MEGEGRVRQPVGAREPDDSGAAYAQAEAQRLANVRAHENALAHERSVGDRARHDLAAAEELRSKLVQVLPHYREQEIAFEKLARDGFAGRLMLSEKVRDRIEREQDLRSQESVIAAARATIAQSNARLLQIEADYRRQLRVELAEGTPQADRLREELAKQAHRNALLDLRAPQAGVVKDLATHTPGTVVAPGTILMTLVPDGEKLRAEVWVSNEDAGFVRDGQKTQLKFSAFPFQKYGMMSGNVLQVSADATEAPNPNIRSGGLTGRDRPVGALAFRALIDLGIKYGGSYYLTYHRFATKEQVEACYPQFKEFLELKVKHDPNEMFQSDWYRHYKKMFGLERV